MKFAARLFIPKGLAVGLPPPASSHTQQQRKACQKELRSLDGLRSSASRKTITSPTHLTRERIGDAGIEWAQSKQFLDTDGDGLHIPPGFRYICRRFGSD